ncbi:hypothetical protein JXL83_06160 [candidate division WOR-3 bacterium]|nr:hypothetical protein [candidate division WOR-3 bacterium]
MKKKVIITLFFLAVFISGFVLGLAQPPWVRMNENHPGHLESLHEFPDTSNLILSEHEDSSNDVESAAVLTVLPETLQTSGIISAETVHTDPPGESDTAVDNTEVIFPVETQPETTAVLTDTFTAPIIDDTLERF